MAYKVLISVGSGKNKATAGSVSLPNKERVASYVKRSPLGNYKTQIKVKDLVNKKVFTGSKAKFSVPSSW